MSAPRSYDRGQSSFGPRKTQKFKRSENNSRSSSYGSKSGTPRRGIPAARVPSYVACVRGENEDATLTDNKDTRPTIVLRVRGISQLSSHLPFPYSSSHHLVLVNNRLRWSFPLLGRCSSILGRDIPVHTWGSLLPRRLSADSGRLPAVSGRLHSISGWWSAYVCWMTVSEPRC